MLEVTLDWALPAPAPQAFSYLTEPENWHAFFPGFIAFAEPLRTRWKSPGDQVVIIARTLGIKRHIAMTLLEHGPGERVRFVMRQAGLPEILHERTFVSVGATCRIRLDGRYAPRAGSYAVVDRLLLRCVLRRGFESAGAALALALEDPNRPAGAQTR